MAYCIILVYGIEIIFILPFKFHSIIQGNFAVWRINNQICDVNLLMLVFLFKFHLIGGMNIPDQSNEIRNPNPISGV